MAEVHDFLKHYGIVNANAIDDDDIYLKHHGRKGMKWYQNIFSKAKNAGLRSRSKTKVSNLSDQELRNRINRIQMEKQYRQLTYNPSLAKRGSQWVGKLLGGVGTELAKTYITAYSKGVINKQILKKAPNIASVMGLK